jgi:flagellar biosynthesis/type III secretory pathway chaperone
MSDLQEHLSTLEDILVREFRICQTLYSITKEEQKFLSNGDTHEIISLIERKESILDQMNQLEENLRVTISELAQIIDLPSRTTSLAEIISTLDDEFSERLQRLREGIIALLGVIRNLTFGNQAVATNNIERIDSVQAFLLDLFKLFIDYDQLGKSENHLSAKVLNIDYQK